MYLYFFFKNSFKASSFCNDRCILRSWYTFSKVLIFTTTVQAKHCWAQCRNKSLTHKFGTVLLYLRPLVILFKDPLCSLSSCWPSRGSLGRQSQRRGEVVYSWLFEGLPFPADPRLYCIPVWLLSSFQLIVQRILGSIAKPEVLFSLKNERLCGRVELRAP